MSRRFLVLPLAFLGVLLTAPACFAAPEKALSEVMVDVEADARPVQEVLRKLERDHGLNYVVAQRVLEKAGLVNVHLRRVSLEDALHAICTACGLKLQIRGRILILLPVGDSRPVPAPVRRPRTAPEQDTARPTARPVRSTDFSTRPTRARRKRTNLARAVGEVLSVDVKAGRLQLDTDGLKVDFYAPSINEVADPARAARMRSTLARLEVGHQVALEYQSLKGRLIIESLVGGTKVRVQGSGFVRRRPAGSAKAKPVVRRNKKGGVTGSRNPLQAPESTTAIPNGVLTGSFVDFAGERARVKRGDGEIVSVYVPSGGDADLRAKIVKVLEALKPGARVFFLYEGLNGRMILKSTGITEIKPTAPKK
ncbi:MAG: hypothetical protein JKY65_24935 [Planctomycetes bacterium]|nr:hypothetical protein [Planctomycetota bacterium]